MEINSLMSAQLLELQQTVQMSVMQNAMNMNTAAAVQLLENMPEHTVDAHPYKGGTIDISV